MNFLIGGIGTSYLGSIEDKVSNGCVVIAKYSPICLSGVAKVVGVI